MVGLLCELLQARRLLGPGEHMSRRAKRHLLRPAGVICSMRTVSQLVDQWFYCYSDRRMKEDSDIERKYLSNCAQQKWKRKVEEENGFSVERHFVSGVCRLAEAGRGRREEMVTGI